MTTIGDDPARPLKELSPKHDYFIGIDSDGCAFDTMEIKHKECFIPNTIKHWNLQPVSRYARQAAEFVNLYSQWRGINRFPALLMVFDLLARREEVHSRSLELPDVVPLRNWIERETMLGNPALRRAVEQTSDPILENALRWSEAVNASIAEMVKGVPPFPFVSDFLTRAGRMADIVVVSATPGAALAREWQEHDLAQHARLIAGQEMGTKAEHLALATNGKYPPGRVLMIGDAPGDLHAARTCGALFYPIVPGDEIRSWRRLVEEGLARFFAESYGGDFEQGLIDEFNAHLPDRPPWER